MAASTFDLLVQKFKELNFLAVSRAQDIDVDNIDKFSASTNFAKTIEIYKIDPDRFYSCFFFLTVNDERKLLDLMTLIPQGVEAHFRLSKVFVFVPIEGDSIRRNEIHKDDNVYDLMLSVHPHIARNKAELRIAMDAYYQEVIKAIDRYKIATSI